VKSLKGEEIDFDLLKTKQELGQKETVLEVRDREDFVHTKRRTRGRAALIQRLNKNKKTRESRSNEETSKVGRESETTTTKTKENYESITF